MASCLKSQSYRSKDTTCIVQTSSLSQLPGHCPSQTVNDIKAGANREKRKANSTPTERTCTQSDPRGHPVKGGALIYERKMREPGQRMPQGQLAKAGLCGESPPGTIFIFQTGQRTSSSECPGAHPRCQKSNDTGGGEQAGCHSFQYRPSVLLADLGGVHC